MEKIILSIATNNKVPAAGKKNNQIFWEIVQNLILILQLNDIGSNKMRDSNNAQETERCTYLKKKLQKE